MHDNVVQSVSLYFAVQGTHRSLGNNQNAKATVTAIIDGTGSLGAALGPLLIGWLTDTLVRSAIHVVSLALYNSIRILTTYCIVHHKTCTCI